MRILLVEDDADLGSSLHRALNAESYVTEWVTSAEQAGIALRDDGFDLIVLDRMLPAMSGVELIKKLRLSQCTIPVLMLTAVIGTEQKVQGLDAGADDYLTKPFDLDELLARIRALLRRREVKPNLIFGQNKLHVDVLKSEMTWQNEVHQLSKNEMIIMRLLIENIDKYVSKNKIEDAISYWETPISSNAIEAHISRLRKRLGKDLIQTMRGVGYKISAQNT